MKYIILAIATISWLAGAPCYAEDALATGLSGYFFDGVGLVGTFASPCNGATQESGNTANSDEALVVTYGCTDGSMKSLEIGRDVDIWLRTNFCASYNACTPERYAKTASSK